MAEMIHPRKDNKGNPVQIKHPHQASPIEAWHVYDEVATVVPDGWVPDCLCGIPLKSWRNAPIAVTDWKSIAGQATIEEPEFKAPVDKKKAAGVVIVENNQMIWVVAPTNAFGGYKATFPKGRVEDGLSPQVTAIREAYEESGLRVKIEAYLGDMPRSETYTRYYVARRIDGNPADMGWESQAVQLVPESKLESLLHHKNDQAVIQALRAYLESKRLPDIYPYQLIQNEGASHTQPVTLAQANHLIGLIDLFHRSVLDHYGISDAAAIPLNRYGEVFELHAYQLLVSGGYATGFVCRGFEPSVPLNEVNRDPAMFLGHCNFNDLRHYVHTLLRGERWADGYGSQILEAAKSGALRLVATRLQDDHSLQR
jgi:8-oxo-dGTP pyrophosphatase MutT (NUDIX family)